MAGSSFKLGKFHRTVANITSAAGTTTLTNTSDYWQYVTGSTTQTVKLPDATTMVTGVGFSVINANSAGAVTVVDNGSNTLATLSPGSSMEFIADSIGSSNGVWIKNGGMGSNLTVASISSNVTLTINSANLVNTSAARTLTLPVPTAGTIVFVKDSAGIAATNNITIDPHASETINGSPSYVVSANYGSVQFTSDGTNWYVLDQKTN